MCAQQQVRFAWDLESVYDHRTFRTSAMLSKILEADKHLPHRKCAYHLLNMIYTMREYTNSYY